MVMVDAGAALCTAVSIAARYNSKIVSHARYLRMSRHASSSDDPHAVALPPACPSP